MSNLPRPFPPTWRERVARRVGLWSMFGRLALWSYDGARRKLPPTHPDAPEVNYRYTQLRQEFPK